MEDGRGPRTGRVGIADIRQQTERGNEHHLSFESLQAIVRNGGMSNGPGIRTSDWAVGDLPRCDINH